MTSNTIQNISKVSCKDTCHLKLVFFLTFYMFGPCFRTLAVILVQIYFIFDLFMSWWVETVLSAQCGGKLSNEARGGCISLLARGLGRCTCTAKQTSAYTSVYSLRFNRPSTWVNLPACSHQIVSTGGPLLQRSNTRWHVLMMLYKHFLKIR